LQTVSNSKDNFIVLFLSIGLNMCTAQVRMGIYEVNISLLCLQGERRTSY